MPSARRSASTAVAAVLLVQALLLAWMVWTRRINADEGIYLSASYAVAHGQLPYRDFMYPQMPYFAYLYAPLFLIGAPPLMTARAVSALASLCLSWLMSRVIVRRGLPVAAHIALLAFFALHALKLSTHSTAITHAVSDGGALLSLLALETNRPLLAGLSVGLAAGFRLPLAPLVILYAVTLWWQGQARAIPRLAIGFALALAPVVPFIASDPGNFMFGTFTLHTMRGHFPSLAAAWTQKVVMLVKWIAFPQDLLLLGITASAAAAVPLLPLAATVLLSVIFLRATPTYLIYVVQVLPFLFVAAAPGFTRLVRQPLITGVVALVYAASLLPTLGYSPVHLFSDDVAHEDRLWNRATVNSVVDLIQAHSSPTSRVLSWWEGYPPLAGRPGYPDVGFWQAMAARKLGGTDAIRAHCMTRDDIGRLIAQSEPDMIVAPDDVWREFLPQIHEHYQQVGAVDLIHVYQRRSPS